MDSISWPFVSNNKQDSMHNMIVFFPKQSPPPFSKRHLILQAWLVALGRHGPKVCENSFKNKVKSKSECYRNSIPLLFMIAFIFSSIFAFSPTQVYFLQPFYFYPTFPILRGWESVLYSARTYALLGCTNVPTNWSLPAHLLVLNFMLIFSPHSIFSTFVRKSLSTFVQQTSWLARCDEVSSHCQPT